VPTTFRHDPPLAAPPPRPLTLPQLLDSAVDDDLYEEDAYDWLEQVGATPASHSRRYLYQLAWTHGWRPTTPPSAPQ
jgi:hypothetical protein